MRANAQSPLATALLLIPILTVPLLAIFGVPELTPIVPSALDEAQRESKRKESGAPEFVPGPSRNWEEFGNVQTAATNVVENAWPDVQPDATSRTLADRRAVAAVRTVAATDDDFAARQPAATTNQPLEEPTIPRGGGNGLGTPFTRTDAPTTTAVTKDKLGYYRDSVPVRASTSPSPGRTAVPAVAAAVEPLTWKSAVRRLDQLEIRNFRLERGQQAEQFVFICSYTPPDNPRISYRFEAEADDPLKAVERVFTQIDAWLASR